MGGGHSTYEVIPMCGGEEKTQGAMYGIERAEPWS